MAGDELSSTPGGGGGQPCRWTAVMECAYQEAVHSLGGLEAATPKPLFELLAPKFPGLNLQNVKWHLAHHRRREEGARIRGPDAAPPPLRWVGSSWRVRGLDAAQPHALLDLLQDEFPELTAQHIKDHLRQHRMRARTQRQFSKPSPSVTTLRRSEATPPKRPQPEPQPHEGRARRAAQAGTQQAQQAALPQRTTAAAAPQQDWAAPGGEAAAAHHRAELERAAQLSGKLSGLSGHTLGVHSQLSGVVSEALPGDTGALPALQQCRMRAACYLLPAALQALDAAAVRRRRCLEVVVELELCVVDLASLLELVRPEEGAGRPGGPLSHLGAGTAASSERHLHRMLAEVAAQRTQHADLGDAGGAAELAALAAVLSGRAPRADGAAAAGWSGGAPSRLAAVAATALVTPVWHLAGRATQSLRLPAITGIMLAGIASGPQALGLLSAAGMPALAPLSALCLSLIALAAGAELHLPELRRLRRQVLCVTAGIAAFSWVLVYACMRLLSGSIPFVRGLSPADAAAVCTLAATLAIARSPASAIAVLKETDGKGPYCSLVMAVVVVKDVLLFACFAVNMELARAVVSGKAAAADGSAALWLLVVPSVTILESVLLGVLGGFALARLLRMPSTIISIAGGGASGAPGAQPGGVAPQPLLLPAGGGHAGPHGGGRSGALRLLRHPVAARLRPLALLCVSGATWAAAELLEAEPLLACVAAGLLASNWRHDLQAGREAAELLSADLSRLAPLVNSLFFGLVGASLKLSAVRDSLWAAAILYAVRLAGVWLGCWAGGQAGGAQPEVARRMWMGMVTQAGIALGLAQTVAARFPAWGADFAALVAGVVMMNLLTGPPLFKAAVVAAGEARSTLSLPDAQPMPRRSGSSPRYCYFIDNSSELASPPHRRRIIMAFQTRDIGLLVVAFFLPPLAVFIARDSCDSSVLLNILLTLLGWIPGIIHAVWVLLKT
ncbi:monovalent Cation:Proton antiporter-1 family [Micractinium conductrix]|uniref:Monovalent Cation:Proton antiporter-1 family n=1 Tax=Micractinium conductrix TaxID=554055 RepID=A0A2P6V7Q8_9CHLO|nr:monovalent Cation:Proton antiporter-1 family [Micractinium conductrix]|eukprot:PSC70125.1 monovalent Cation:Proton antiporter-1 family [Micractinium conductrix]